MIILLLVVLLGIIALDVPRLIKNGMWRELFAYSIFMAIGIALSVSQVLGLFTPNPSKPVELIFKPLAEWLKK